ncbi:DUF3307 domain-containing protein [Anaerovorax odorimutans]|uniref:DUF3307 domain-containing protein n=1 Tax=Anaerovorax odorimutans TaxID=109327 RepID=UPI0004820E0E|nr:DUF3307 domain-containing protein [Anaerovorax odorimutans]
MIILSMIFLHIVDDFYLQGWLKNAKQRQWWVQNAPQDLYKYDYLWALLIHSFSWSFMIMFPIMAMSNFQLNFNFYVCFSVNVIIHFITDNFKANKKRINLIQDQCIHMAQILITYIILVIYLS